MIHGVVAVVQEFVYVSRQDLERLRFLEQEMAFSSSVLLEEVVQRAND